MEQEWSTCRGAWRNTTGLETTGEQRGATTRMRSKPSRRRFLAWALTSSAFLFFTFDPQSYETHSSLAGDHGTHFTLCDRKLFLKDMPKARHGAERPFGVYKWNRSLDNVILIENRTGGRFDYGRIRAIKSGGSFMHLTSHEIGAGHLSCTRMGSQLKRDCALSF